MKVETVEESIKKLKKGNKSLYLLSILVGMTTGVVVSLYRYGLLLITKLREHFVNLGILDTPLEFIMLWIIFILVGFFINFLSKKYPLTSGSGIPQVKGIILRKVDYIHWIREFFVKFIGGLLGIGAGLSLGREGPSVQLGSYIGYGFTKIFKRDYIEKKYLVTAGASAGLSGAFGAPLSGVIFSMEELHRFFSSKLIICTFIASILSNFVSRRIFGIMPSFSFMISYPSNINPYLQFSLFILFGAIIAIFGKIFTLTLIKSQTLYKKIKFSDYIKVGFVMSLAFIITIVFPDLTGGGHHLVEQLPYLKQSLIFLIAIFIIKLLFTTISYATGFQGGIFLPMLVLGAILGKIYALALIGIFQFPPEFITHYMILGMAGYFVAVVRAPITGIVLILEMTGNFDHLLAISTVSIVAYYITDILKLEPIYEILYERMPKFCEEKDECEKEEKVLIAIPVSAETEFDNKQIKEVVWPKNTLVVSIKRGETEIIPKGDTLLQAGDLLILLLPKKLADSVNEELFKKGTYC